jgi:Fe-S-cluster containining protein
MARPKVTRAEFDQIECNRCGACCTKLWLPGPLKMAEFLAAGSAVQDPSPDWVEENDRFIAWLSALEPTGKVDLMARDGATHQYSCSRFTHLDDGSGFCTAYEDRPSACRGFPYGEPVRGEDFKDCSYYVDIVPDNPVRRGLRLLGLR